MNKNNLKIIILGLFILLFSGCSLGATKKTEINTKNIESTEQSTETAPQEDENASDNQTENQEVSQENEPKKIESSLDASEEVSNSQDDSPKTETEEPAAPDFKIKDKLVSWGFQKSSGRKIDTVIVHSSYNSLGGDVYDLDKIIDIYKSYGVSPHYIIDRKGQIYRLVEDKNIAYHAGDSKVPDGRTNVNGFSIGIEVVNTKDEGPSSAQYSALKDLIRYLKDKYDIKYVLGHSDIAPGRKDDPWSFDWKKIGGKEK